MSIIYVVTNPGSHSNPSEHYRVSELSEVVAVLNGDKAIAEYYANFNTLKEAVVMRDNLNCRSVS